MNKIRIDIVSDVVCPWCIIGYKRLEHALIAVANEVEADIQWHPFELNPAMRDEGQNMREHLAEKYGTTTEASISARETLTKLGNEVGFEFNFNDDSRIYNTRKAHQLLMWAQSEGKQFDLELALFQAYFTDGKDISDSQVLIECTTELGLEQDVVTSVIEDESWAEAVASTEQQWLEAGINAVPAIIINRKHLISGAQTTELLISAINQIAQSQQ
ncbi:DsbA family oxidoreductase [Vibrio europaeus]|uniref:DsbA family oxidoreductase n=1 Tax=Vibrio europaeus TaxID=300876 RepID=UPI00233E7750|nr:DsbA family oxidoreductase [Vibrio europaeus]MDC5720698.1 DsbA family oxidoreductase [Vibrio europaeus]MDC5755416.1 DsbA family oxidoreductase [Vibrio europaeus]MDC5775995.1 DsbA family oxidoreductase [Vibrio europaeus]MDC5795133.1 DsbA family oxidoreductase [Vibrio europaeus]MDC5799704.1 DsbA family oxidoreductase [Vibrio europaeus]